MFYVFLNEDLKAMALLSHSRQKLSEGPSGSPRAPHPPAHVDPKNHFFNQNQEPGCAMPPPPAGPVQARASCVVIVAWRVPQSPCERVPGGQHCRPLPPSVSMNKANLSVAGNARAGQGWVPDGGGRRASRSQPAPLPSLGPAHLAQV